MKVIIASDHAGVELKAELVAFLQTLAYDVHDYGPLSTASVDYPDFAEKVATHIQKEPTALGVLICGTGIGVSIVANKFKGVRCALCSDSYTARVTRQHNNSNIVALGARVIGSDLAKEIVQVFLGASFEGERHTRRLAKITEIENKEC